MAHYVQVLNDLVVNVWDCPPKVPVGEEGWRNAEMILPSINEQKQYLGNWTYDLTVDPVVISREVFSYTVEERKQNLHKLNEDNFYKFVEITAKNPIFYSQAEIDSIKNNATTNKNLINSAVTHNDLDNLNLSPLELF